MRTLQRLFRLPDASLEFPVPTGYPCPIQGAAIADPTEIPAQLTSHPPVASARHTILVLLILMLISFLGATLHFRFSSTPHWARLGVYAWGILMEWSLLLYIAYGVRTRGVSMRELIGPIKPGLGAGLRDFFLAVGFLFVADLILVLVGGVLRPPPSRAIENIIPHGNVETAIYLLLCVSAGICEELVFRGYLQRQFAAFTGSASMALILQGLFFGISHGYQGVTRMFIIAILGCMLGVLARRRGNLRPGMIAHFLQDAVAGILASRLMK